MSVTAILNQKGSTAVETIAGSVTLAEAAAKLAEKKIGALVVSENGERVDGIVSERDIVKLVGRNGAEALTHQVSEIMTRKVECADLGEHALKVLRRMTEGRFRHMPVVEDGKLRAVISIGDVVNFRLREMEMEKQALEGMIIGN